MSATSAAQSSARAVTAFSRWNSEKAWHPDQPEIDEWGQAVLSALQQTLTTIVLAQKEIAEQVEQNAYDIQQLLRRLDQD